MADGIFVALIYARSRRREEDEWSGAIPVDADVATGRRRRLDDLEDWVTHGPLVTLHATELERHRERIAERPAFYGC